MKKTFFVTLLLTFLASFNLFANGINEESDGLIILASTNIIGDVAQNIAGDIQTIEVLVPKGGNPHNYEPSPRDMALVEDADLIFVNGLALEETLLEVLEQVSTGNIVEVSSTIKPIGFEEGEEHEHHDEEMHEEEHHDHHDGEAHEDEHDDHHDGEADEHHDHHDQDPHTWTSPLNVIQWTTVITQALVAADPANAAAYEANAETYRAKLEALDSKIRTEIATIADEDKLLVSDHSVFGYFAKDYGFETMGALLPSFSTNSEISARDLSELIELVEEHHIKAIFVGNTAGEALKKLAEVLAEESDHPLQILPVLTGSLTETGEEGDSYISFIEYNVNQIVKGLRTK